MKLTEALRPLTILFFASISIALAAAAPGNARVQNAGVVTVCAQGCDFKSIQSALEAAPDGSTIFVDDPVHTEAAISLSRDVTIQGKGPHQTIVQAHDQPRQASERVFSIAPEAVVTIRDMTIRHGNPTRSPESGGGIRSEGDLTLINVIVRDNSGSAGAGLQSDGSLTIINSEIHSNQSRGGGDSNLECSTGGGLKVLAGPARVIDSAIYNNQAEGKGGGIHVACNGILEMTNTTVSGNHTMIDGGGIFINGVALLTHVTIADNHARTGGGVYLEGSGEQGLIRGQLNYTATIIAGNTYTFEKYGVADCMMGDHASIGGNTDNFVGDGSCQAAMSGDPKLGKLTAAGHEHIDSDQSLDTHLPPVHVLLEDSPALDAIPANECELGLDAWGTSRPQGGSCDIGAYELPPPSITTLTGAVLGLGLGAFVLALVALAGRLLARSG